MTEAATHRRTAGAGVRRYFRRTFSSLGMRNYRLYFIGQGTSLTGTFMQGVAQAWLVLTLTGSATTVGIVSALQFGPVLVLGPYGGVLADRFSKRRLLFFTQSAAAVFALAMWILVATHAVQIWMVYAVAACMGVVNSIDNPVRQTFVYELVGGDRIGNAVTLNSTVLNLSRIVGPALAGVLIATAGMAVCFLVNAASFVAVLLSMALMRPSEMRRAELLPPAKGQLREGFAYVARTPLLRAVIVMAAFIGTLTFEFQVSLAALARHTFDAGAAGYSLLSASMGVGAVIGGLVLAGVHRPGKRMLVAAAFAFGASTALVAISPGLRLAAAAMALVGAASIAFSSVSNTILQLHSAPRMRGRVVSLWSTAFIGSTVVGAPTVGWLADRFSPPTALAAGALAATAAGLYGLIEVRRRTEKAAPVSLPAAISAEDIARRSA